MLEVLQVLQVLNGGCGSERDFWTRRIGLHSVSSHGWGHDTSRGIVGSLTPVIVEMDSCSWALFLCATAWCCFWCVSTLG